MQERDLHNTKGEKRSVHYGEKEIGHTKALTFNSSIIEDYLAAGDFEEDPEQENIVSYSGDDDTLPDPDLEADDNESSAE